MPRSVIQHTKTTNTAGNQLRLEITGRNFCAGANCGTVYICNEGALNESAKLCFASGDKNNGPAPGVIAVRELASGVGRELSHLKSSLPHRETELMTNGSFLCKWAVMHLGHALIQHITRAQTLKFTLFAKAQFKTVAITQLVLQ